ncbi:hypothetical protein B0H17DRAFT_1155185 [Mycena rosella]|uniref:Uncharacterized protein n=1 Tax=Mycena rosella TaxID=1033263 RepID=A0AAD7AWU4_MYCRO|nr:hypothetical protein B0H17DRAFT_1155185 [Mycena rosella]
MTYVKSAPHLRVQANEFIGDNSGGKRRGDGRAPTNDEDRCKQWCEICEIEFNSNFADFGCFRFRGGIVAERDRKHPKSAKFDLSELNSISQISHHCLHLSSSFFEARPSPRHLPPELSPMNSLACTRKCGALLTYVMGISETMTCDQFMRRRERGRDERSSCRRSDNAEYLPNITGEIEGAKGHIKSRQLAEISSKSATLKGPIE